MLTKSAHFRRLSLVLDNLVATLSWVVAIHIVIWTGKISYDQFFDHLSLLFIVCTVQAWAFYRYYSDRLNILDQLRNVVKAVALVVVVLFAAVFFLRLEFDSRTIVVVYMMISLTALVGLRAAIIYWYFNIRKERTENYTKVLIVGTGPRAQAVSDQLTQFGDWGTDVVGFVDPAPMDSFPSDKRLISSVDDFKDAISGNVVDEVVVAVPRSLLSDIEPYIDVCDAEGIRIKMIAEFYETSAAKVELTRVGVIPMLEFQPVAQNQYMLIVKRIFDLTATMLALPFLAVLFGIVALAIKLDSPGPVFFRQRRVGMNKRMFNMYKFRSMFEDAEERLAEIEHLNEADGPIFKIRNDPRVTRVGRFIR